jgi:hypothetical protein
MKPKKVKKEPKFKYVTSQMEAKYKTIMNVRGSDGNPDWPKWKELQEEMLKNGGMCKAGRGPCVCSEFQSMDKEGPCKAKLFIKELRSEEAQTAYADDTPKFDEDEAVAKKKKKMRDEESSSQEDEESSIVEEGEEDE